MIELIVNALKEFNPEVHTATSGSTYIKFTGSKVREIRISNHSGHKLKPNVWELRSDSMTTRKNPKNRVYNFKDVNKMIKEFK